MNDADEILQTNKTISALNRETEQRIAGAGAKGSQFVVDLRSVPREEWDQWLNFDLVLPPKVATYLDGRTDELPYGMDEVQMLEKEVEKFYGITEPYYATMSPTLQIHGRPWLREPSAGDYLTGFTFDKQ